MNQSINETLNQAAEGIQRIDASLKRVGELTAATLLEMRGGQASVEAVNALVEIMKQLDTLPEADRACVFQSLLEFETARASCENTPR